MSPKGSFNNPFGFKNANQFHPRFFFKHENGEYYYHVNDKLHMNIDKYKVWWEKDGQDYHMTIKEWLAFNND